LAISLNVQMGGVKKLMRVGILCDGNNSVIALASVTDRLLLVTVAQQAIKEAEARVGCERDGRLFFVRQLELERLRATLFGLIPELGSNVKVQ
jgi:hypothetical protein